MERIHAGMAKDGEAWFAAHQWSGKGQRGKTWSSAPGESILLSVALKPPQAFRLHNFHFHALVSLTVSSFLEKISGENFLIKWPNDLFYNDRKAGGILIENIIAGSIWKWAVVGIGINLNQVQFPEDLNRAISLKNITGNAYNAEALARQLHLQLTQAISACHSGLPDDLMERYNQKLFGRGETVKLKKENMVFETRITGVDETGRLLTRDALDRQFTFGSVEWLLDARSS